MFIKLTRIDGQDVWFNSQYVVTVEPRKGSGALVVPLGDGIDYEVRESPEMIVAALGGDLAPGKVKRPPAAVPVGTKPPSVAPADKVANPSSDVVPKEEPELPDFRINSTATPVPFELRNVPEAAEAAVVPPPAKKTVRRKRTTAKSVAVESTSVAKKKKEASAETPAEAAPKKKTVRKVTPRKPKLPPLPLR